MHTSIGTDTTSKQSRVYVENFCVQLVHLEPEHVLRLRARHTAYPQEIWINPINRPIKIAGVFILADLIIVFYVPAPPPDSENISANCPERKRI